MSHLRGPGKVGKEGQGESFNKPEMRPPTEEEMKLTSKGMGTDVFLWVLKERN